MSDPPDQPLAPQFPPPGPPGHPPVQPYAPGYPSAQQYPPPAPQSPQFGYPPPVYPYQPGYPVPGQLSNGIGTAAMVVGIIGLVFFWVPYLGFILGALGVIFGGIGISKANRGEANNKGMAVAGLVCGIVAMAADVLIIIAVVSSVPHF